MVADEKWGKLFPEDHPHPTIDELMVYLMDNLPWATEVRLGADLDQNENPTQEILEVLWGEPEPKSYYCSCVVDRWNPDLDLDVLAETIDNMRTYYLTNLNMEGEGNGK